MIGENREAGEIPARSRHCDALEADGYSATELESGRLPTAKDVCLILERIYETKSGDLPEACCEPNALRARGQGAREQTSNQAPARPTALKGRQELFFCADKD